MVEIYLIQHIGYQLWKSNRKEQLLWPKPCIEAVNTAHPFNQTARLKQTFWRPSSTTTTPGGEGGGFEPPALEIRQPIMHPSLQQAVNDDEERLYFKVGAEQGPTDPVTFNQVVSPIVIKAKVLSVKNKAWYSSPWIWRVLDTAYVFFFLKFSAQEEEEMQERSCSKILCRSQSRHKTVVCKTAH